MNVPAPGTTARFSRTITDADVALFAGVSGDMNPVHIDAEYASRTRFGQRVAHGALIASYVSNVIGNQLPGRGAIYLSSSLRFTKPAFIGDTVTVTVRVKDVRADRPILTLEVNCTNQRDETVLTGESVVLYEPVE